MKYKYLIFSVLLSATGSLVSFAQNPNFLANAFTRDADNFYNSEVFYSKWGYYNAAGILINPSVIPEQSRSYYAEVLENGYVWNITQTAEEKIPGPDVTAEGFNTGDIVAVMDFYAPSGNISDYDGSCYAFRLPEITQPGKYTLSGCVRGMRKIAGDTGNTVMENAAMIFVADDTPGNKSFSLQGVDVGNPHFVVTDKNDPSKEYSNAWTYLPRTDIEQKIPTEPFQLSLNLTTDTKYLSLYAPIQKSLVGELTLIPDMWTDVVEINADLTEEPAEYYDLSGRRLKSDCDLQSGIYIRKCGAKSLLIRK